MLRKKISAIATKKCGVETFFVLKVYEHDAEMEFKESVFVQNISILKEIRGTENDTSLEIDLLHAVDESFDMANNSYSMHKREACFNIVKSNGIVEKISELQPTTPIVDGFEQMWLLNWRQCTTLNLQQSIQLHYSTRNLHTSRPHKWPHDFYLFNQFGLVGGQLEQKYYKSGHLSFQAIEERMLSPLEDIANLSGLQVVREPASGVPYAICDLICLRYLGKSSDFGHTSGGPMELSWLEETFFEYSLDASVEEMECHTRVYILYLVGNTNFSTTIGNEVPIMYVPLFQNFGKAGKYASGAAALSFLYKAERKDVMSKNISIYNSQASALEKHVGANDTILQRNRVEVGYGKGKQSEGKEDFNYDPWGTRISKRGV